MGKIVSIGGGRYENGEIKNIIEYIVSLSETGKKVVYLPTAGFDDMEDVEPIKKLFTDAGCDFSALLLTDKTLNKKDIADTILNADIIYVGGGNVKFMMDTWNETGASDVLRRAYEKGIVMSGYSAGAICWYKVGYDDCGENHSYMFYDCLGILPYCYCPHYESENWQSFKQAVKALNISGVACEDGAALVYIDGKYSTICGNEDGDIYFLDCNNNHSEIKLNKTADILNR